MRADAAVKEIEAPYNTKLRATHKWACQALMLVLTCSFPLRQIYTVQVVGHVDVQAVV